MAMAGLERAIVVAVDDPQERGRCRVRILRLHDEAIPVEHLPWAELMIHGGHGWGDAPHYEIDDLVWVAFEGGDREQPVIVAGWIAAPGDVSDLPSEQTGDYLNDRKRWVKKDRAGNLIEVSEKDDELHVKIKSGEAEIVVTQKDNSFTVTASGPATINVQGDVLVQSGGVVTVGAGSQVNVNPKCVIDGGGSKVLTDAIIPACLFTGSPFVGNPKLEVKP